MKYDDIINLPHHVSTKHHPMSILNRSAQFAPFAALTGYEDAIDETARLTDQKAELDEDAVEELNTKLRMIYEHIEDRLDVEITYYVADKYKSGGRYETRTVKVKKIDTFKNTMTFEDGCTIQIEDIMDMQMP